jgi:hypothetical protein
MSTEEDMARERSDKKSKKEEATSDTHSMDIGMRFALIYFAILFGMTFVFLAAPPAHSASAEIVIVK